MRCSKDTWTSLHLPEPFEPAAADCSPSDNFGGIQAGLLEPRLGRRPRFVTTRRFGDLLLLERLSDVMELPISPQNHQRPGREATLMWRGQADYRWPIEPGAVRRLKSTLQHAYWGDIELRVREYERGLLDDARLRGLDRDGAEHRSELETMAVLQHYGAATRFLDFTTNVLVALWFACMDQERSAGLLLCCEAETCLTSKEVRESTIASLAGTYREGLIRWQPSPLAPRVQAQQSVLAFSRTVDTPAGSLLVEDQDTVRAFVVSTQLKREFVTKAARLLGISGDSLFPDMPGFAWNHGVGRAIPPRILWLMDDALRQAEGPLWNGARENPNIPWPLPNIGSLQERPTQGRRMNPGMPDEPDEQWSLREFQVLRGDPGVAYWHLLHKSIGSIPGYNGVWANTRERPHLPRIAGGTLAYRLPLIPTSEDPETVLVEVQDDDSKFFSEGLAGGRVTSEECLRAKELRELSERILGRAVRHASEDEVLVFEEASRARLEYLEICELPVPEEDAG